MHEKEPILLRIENINFSYGKDRALDQISFQIPQGQYISLIGPNGSGKSTLFEILCGNIKPQQGQVFYKNRDVHTMDFRGRARHFAAIHQNESVNFPYTCMEMVVLGLHPHRERFQSLKQQELEEIKRVMEITDTLRFANKPVTQLSGGERQRVTLARALAQRPRLLLMDEAMSDLDISAKIQMFELLRHLTKEQGLTVLGIHHDINTAYCFSDQVAILSEGRLYGVGTPDQIMNEDMFRTVFGVEVEIYPGRGFFITGNKTRNLEYSHQF